MNNKIKEKFFLNLLLSVNEQNRKTLQESEVKNEGDSNVTQTWQITAKHTLAKQQDFLLPP